MFPSRKSSDDRRFVPRQEIAYRLDVVGADGHHGCLLDISVGGMRLRYFPEQDLSGAEKLTLELPRWLGLERELKVRGRFVWMRTVDTGATEAGFAFHGISKKDGEILAELIRRLAKAVAEDRPSSVVAVADLGEY